MFGSEGSSCAQCAHTDGLLVSLRSSGTAMADFAPGELPITCAVVIVVSALLWAAKILRKHCATQRPLHRCDSSSRADRSEPTALDAR